MAVTCWFCDQVLTGDTSVLYGENKKCPWEGQLQGKAMRASGGAWGEQKWPPVSDLARRLCTWGIQPSPAYTLPQHFAGTKAQPGLLASRRSCPFSVIPAGLVTALHESLLILSWGLPVCMSPPGKQLSRPAFS